MNPNDLIKGQNDDLFGGISSDEDEETSFTLPEESETVLALKKSPRDDPSDAQVSGMLDQQQPTWNPLMSPPEKESLPEDPESRKSQTPPIKPVVFYLPTDEVSMDMPDVDQMIQQNEDVIKTEKEKEPVAEKRKLEEVLPTEPLCKQPRIDECSSKRNGIDMVSSKSKRMNNNEIQGNKQCNKENGKK